MVSAYSFHAADPGSRPADFPSKEPFDAQGTFPTEESWWRHIILEVGALISRKNCIIQLKRDVMLCYVLYSNVLYTLYSTVLYCPVCLHRTV